MLKPKKIRYAARAVLNMGNYETIHIEYEEEIDVVNYVEDKKGLIERVTKTVESQVVKIRKGQ